MVVFSNQRLGPHAELLVSTEVAAEMLWATAQAACPVAKARWEFELVAWLSHRATATKDHLDVAEIAWTPDHFELQLQFLVAAIRRAAQGSSHASALERWCSLVEAYPRSSVQVSRRWSSSLNI